MRRGWSTNWLLLIAIAFGLAFSAAMRADETPVKGDRAVPMMTPEREAAALHFARSHHPELADLIERLRKDMRGEYDQAVRQLYQASERLARVKERSEADYDQQLAQWKLDSRIKLLAARMSVSSDSKLEGELKKLLRQRVELKRVQLEQERARAQSRLDRVDESLANLSDTDAVVEKEFRRYRGLKNNPPARVSAPARKSPPVKAD